MDTITIYTDGSCRPNPGKTGHASILLSPKGSVLILTSGRPHGTSPAAEASALIQGLAALKQPCRVEVVSDSQYVRSLVHPASGSTAQSNADLRAQLNPLLASHLVSVTWTPGHAADDSEQTRINQLCHTLAYAALGSAAEPLSTRGTKADLDALVRQHRARIASVVTA